MLYLPQHCTERRKEDTRSDQVHEEEIEAGFSAFAAGPSQEESGNEDALLDFLLEFGITDVITDMVEGAEAFDLFSPAVSEGSFDSFVEQHVGVISNWFQSWGIVNAAKELQKGDLLFRRRCIDVEHCFLDGIGDAGLCKACGLDQTLKGSTNSV